MMGVTKVKLCFLNDSKYIFSVKVNIDKYRFEEQGENAFQSVSAGSELSGMAFSPMSTDVTLRGASCCVIIPYFRTHFVSDSYEKVFSINLPILQLSENLVPSLSSCGITMMYGHYQLTSSEKLLIQLRLLVYRRYVPSSALMPLLVLFLSDVIPNKMGPEV
jgi:hypothetical protein